MSTLPPCVCFDRTVFASYLREEKYNTAHRLDVCEFDPQEYSEFVTLVRSCLGKPNSMFDKLRAQFEYKSKSTISSQINNHSAEDIHGFRYHQKDRLPPDGV